MLVAAFWLLRPTDNETPAATAAVEATAPAGASAATTNPASDGNCQRIEKRAKNDSKGGHPAQRFYAPTEAAPEQDLAHVIGDGYVID